MFRMRVFLHKQCAFIEDLLEVWRRQGEDYKRESEASSLTRSTVSKPPSYVRSGLHFRSRVMNLRSKKTPVFAGSVMVKSALE